MKRKRLTLFVVLALIISITGMVWADSPFEDTAGHAYEEAIIAMVGLGVLEGHGDGTFGPDGVLNRAQAAKVAAILVGLTEADAEEAREQDYFTDVGEDMPANLVWARGWINLIAQDEVVKGYGDDVFGPGDTLTISQWTTILIRILGFETEDMMADWPAAYDEEAASLGLDEGIDYEGSREITRGEMAQFCLAAVDVELPTGGTLRDTLFAVEDEQAAAEEAEVEEEE